MKIKLRVMLLPKCKGMPLIIMRSLIFFFCTVVFSFSSGNLLSQNAKITVDADKIVTVEEVFDLIDRQTDYSFVYKPDLFTNLPAVHLRKGTIPINKLIQKSLSTGSFDITINENKTIYIKEKVLKEAPPYQKSVSGKITDEKGVPLPGASIVEKGTTNGTQTDFDGNFNITLTNDNAVLVISYIGFATKEIPVEGQTDLQISLSPDTANLDEVVVVGYGTKSKVKLTNSVSTIKQEDITDIAVASFEEGIAGQLPGVQIVQTSGAPGGGADINIRGIGTLTAGTSPLIVVDGFPSENLSLNSINPSAIESVDILKDAAAAIYGSRGSNGVILVTTKKGKQGDVKISYDGYSGFQGVAKTVDVQDAYEFANFVATARRNRGRDPLELYQPYVIGYEGLTNTNWQDEIFRQAFIQNHNVTVSGATDKMNFFVSTGYFDQDGIILGSYYNRLNFRANLNFDISDKFRAGFNLAPSYSNRNKISDGDHKGNGVVMSALIANPVYSPYNSDGSLNLNMVRTARENGQAQVENPVALALLNKDERSRFDMLGGGFLEFEPFNTITYKSYIGFNYSYGAREFFSPNTLGAYQVTVEDKQPTAFNSDSERKNWVIENTIRFDKKFNDVHNMSGLIGQSYQTETSKYTSKNPLQFQTTNVNGVLTTTYPLFQEEWSLISYFGRLNYDFKDKYVLSASIRRDGSSRFGANTKWGWFPSVSGAWRLTQENFFNSETISEVKVRGSWGVTGNNSIPNYGAIPLLGGVNYGDNIGAAPTTSPNENLSWEQTETLDVGVDIGLFNNKLNFVADYYKATTNDLLLNVPVPSHSGNTSSLRNIGKVENTGLELAINVSNIRLGNVKWSSTFNISTNKNKVLELGPDQDRILTSYHITEIGKPIGSYYTYRLLGVFENQEQIDNAPEHPEQGLGDYRFADLDGDGKITSDDREISGDFFPDYTFGFSNTFKYKNFDFKFLFQGKQGYEIYNGTSFFVRNLEGWSNGHASLNDFYSETNTNATYGHPGKHVKTYERSKILIEDGSYIRLRKVSLGYTFPEEILKNIFIDKMKIYVSGKNLFTITDYTGFNPEVASSNKSFNDSTIEPGFDYGAYPVERSLVLGVKLSF